MAANLLLGRSPNPVQRVQGYVERAETVTIPGNPPQNIQVQKSYPGATVTVYERKPDGKFQSDEKAKIFNRDGSFMANPLQADGTAYYIFYAQPGRYDIQFSGTSPEFMLEDMPIESLVFNVRDYGARGDGDADDPNRDDGVAIRAAIEVMKEANGGPLSNGLGTLHFPNGIYVVRTPIDLPSGITLQGTNSQYSGNAGSNCLIVLATENSSLFKIGTNRQRIIIRDLGMTTLGTAILPGSRAIDATEDIPGGTVTGVEFDNLTIWGFERGISVEGSHLSDQWDFNNVKVNHCNIGECDFSIYLNSQNCDFWRIADSRIGAGILGDGIHLEKVGIITIDSVLGAGSVSQHPPRRANNFIHMTPAHGTVTIINSECEGFLQSIRLSSEVEANIGWPIVVLNSAFGEEILLGHNCDYISLGNRYQPQTVKCVENGNDVMIYSFGDIFASNVDDLPRDDRLHDFVLQGNSRVVSRANRFRVDFQQPARFGGKAGQIAETLAETALAVSTFNDSQEQPQAQIALCNESGDVLFHVRADAGFIYFEAPPESPGLPNKKLMRLSSKGNLTIRGAYSQDPNL
jgi:hypothetical protein